MCAYTHMHVSTLIHAYAHMGILLCTYFAHIDKVVFVCMQLCECVGVVELFLLLIAVELLQVRGTRMHESNG